MPDTPYQQISLSNRISDIGSNIIIAAYTDITINIIIIRNSDNGSCSDNGRESYISNHRGRRRRRKKKELEKKIKKKEKEN